MARMIDAYQAIDIIDEWLDSVGTVMVGKGLSSYGELIGCIEEAPTLTPPNEWVSVEERLPYAEYGESDTVLCYTDIGVEKLLYFDGGNWCFPTGETFLHKVTHWMPLPAPPPNGSAADTNVGAKDKNIPTKEPNEPLTLEELREMDGEPVWLELEMAWALVEVKPNGGVMFHGNDFTRTFSYCWDTYRRPPEGEEET